jgi:hypothetical protein
MRNVYKLFLIAFSFIALTAVLALVLPSNTKAGSDCDGNAVIYCGVSSTYDLNKKIKNGTGKPYQSGSELTALFSRYGYTAADAGNLKSGYVNKNNTVTVGGKVVASGVYSMGRHWTQGSTDVPGVSYPLYLRHPQYSFVSQSIPAYILYNYDGSFRMAIIASCGNIVPGTIKTKPKEAAPTYRLNINKWNDLNGDQVRQPNEPVLPGWTFDITGPNGYARTVTTSPNGGITVTHLANGTYTVRERLQNGWTPTTSAVQTITIRNADGTLWFGNRQRSAQLYALTIYKWHDVNGDGARQVTEPLLSGWTFDVRGTNYANAVTTGTNGSVRIAGLNQGTYTVVERSQPNWVPTTSTNQTINLTNNFDAWFGNRYNSAQRGSLAVYKFEDINGDTLQATNEPLLAGWQFNVVGPGTNTTLTTDANGSAILTNLADGVYTITEINQVGWTNTTGLTRTVIISNANDQVAIFGNRRQGGSNGGGGEGSIGTLSSSGPGDMAGAIAASMSLSGGALAWMRSRKNFKKALKQR